ncbi:GerW family sporulation protein [Lederbergia galactosidilytica]|uniref:Spore protein n=1 Tax=Lederbergia galactosidilytica TaxID=217031 RepID=A0A177ZL64_9BACI|nr:GerW family sporulation protein [Lederbergia galactosidilytica]KRG14548.1 spore protein [Virgibacillus soli]MBP1915378.1 sporulation protein YtfJ [Lederbergia galactosidilytica]OAK68189.1 spore protein [Lederbergia galactosidilytica]
MSDHPIQALMTTAMENLKDMIDVNTIIGEPVETPDGGVILTVSKVGFGFAMGGSEFRGGSSGNSSDDQSSEDESGSKFPFGGGSGGGVSITPIAFLVVNKHGVNMLHLEQNTHLLEKMIDNAPAAIDKIQKMIKKNSQQQQNSGQNSDLDFDI